MVEGDTRRDINVDTDQKYQEKVEVDANIICQLKQRYQLNKGHDDMAIPDAEDFLHISSYPLLKYMGFGTGISDGVAKVMTATILVEIVLLHHHTKNPLKYVYTNSKYGHLVAMPASGNLEFFSKAAIDKGWVG